MNRTTITPGAVVVALVLSSCASEQIAPPVASVVPVAAPTDIGEAVELAKTQRGAGDLDGATATLSQLVLVAPDDPRVLGEYGKILLERGATADALAFLQRALELNPGEWSIYSAQGVGFAQSGDFHSAHMAFGRALMLKPNDPVILNNFALAHLQAGNLDQAESLLLRAASSGGSLPKVAQNLALVRQMRGDAPSGAPSGGSASKAVFPAALEEVPESDIPVPMDVARPPDSQEGQEAAVVEPVVIEEPVEQSAEEVVAQAGEPIIENELIETAELEELETTDGAAQALMAEAEERAAQDEVVEKAAQEEAPVSAATVSDIWIPSSGPIYLQVGAFASDQNAGRLVEKLESLNPQVAIAAAGERTIHRVVVGPYAYRDEAHVALDALAEFGIEDVQVLTRLPGEAQRREEIADEGSSDATLADLANESSEIPQAAPSLSYAESR